MRIAPTEKLNKRVVHAWRFTALIISLIVSIFCAIPFVVLFMLDVFTAGYLLMPAGLFALLFIVFVIILPQIRYTRFRYYISDDEISIKKGILVITYTVVPMIKIQYTDTKHGPVMRTLRLAAVNIMTAGGTVEIPGLPFADAEAMRDRITELVKTVKENV
ncbi:MAG: PH domain-containing protein [Clostridiales Family XIII bacterium]|jgi:membrane protein YdbS with pleckstrin-like domain|nr:PH domain-containing protein [Clostridiales Family XIII bacterium]